MNNYERELYKKEIDLRNSLIRGLIRIITDKDIDDWYLEEILLEANRVVNLKRKTYEQDGLAEII